MEVDILVGATKTFISDFGTSGLIVVAIFGENISFLSVVGKRIYIVVLL